MPTQPRAAWRVPAADDEVGAGPEHSLSRGVRGRAGGSAGARGRRWVGGCGVSDRRRGLAREEPGEGERSRERRGARRVCGRERVRAPHARSRRPRAPSPRLRPLPACSLPSSPRPALPPSPRNQCSCCRAGCGFLQSLPRPPLRPERARSPAQQRPPVPSCEPRPQPRTASRSRVPAHPPGRRGAGGGRDPGAPTPLSAGGRWGA